MKVVIAGAGSYGQVYLQYIREQDAFEVVGFFDDSPEKKGDEIAGLPVLGSTRHLDVAHELDVAGVLAPIGNNRARVRILTLARESGFKTPNFIHNTAIVSDVSVPMEGSGVYILPNSIIMPFVTFEDFVMVSMGVKIAHHTRWGRGAFVSTGANVGAGIELGDEAFLGIGCTVMTGLDMVGARATIGAGAVVIRDVPRGATVVGNPARVIDQTQGAKDEEPTSQADPIAD